MGKYIKIFNNHSEYEAFKASKDYITPNVSYCVSENEVHYNPLKETKLVVYYDIQDISSPITVCTNYDNSIKSMEVDGVMLDNIVKTYQFNKVGEHIIKYEFTNPTSVGNGLPLFLNVDTIKRVIIPDTFTSISNNAFNSCSSLTSVTIGNSVTSIDVYAFVSCNSLSTITSYIMNAPSVSNGTFGGVSNGGTLYVPIGSSGYDTWMNNYGNLGMRNWTKVEQ